MTYLLEVKDGSKPPVTPETPVQGRESARARVFAHEIAHLFGVTCPADDGEDHGNGCNDLAAAIAARRLAPPTAAAAAAYADAAAAAADAYAAAGSQARAKFWTDASAELLRLLRGSRAGAPKGGPSRG